MTPEEQVGAAIIELRRLIESPGDGSGRHMQGVIVQRHLADPRWYIRWMLTRADAK